MRKARWLVGGIVVALTACGPGAVNNPPEQAAVADAAAPPAPTQNGSVMPIEIVQLDGFVANGFFPESAPENGDIQQIVGSYGASGDATIGSAEFTIALVEDAQELLMPVASGPTVDGLGLEAICGETAALVEIEAGSNWALTPISLNHCADTNELRVRVIDTSSEWGSWVAVAAPILPAS
ncbi:MAG: hypothetical protein AAFX86_15545 [Pseudomonadota bacterium]